MTARTSSGETVETPALLDTRREVGDCAASRYRRPSASEAPIQAVTGRRRHYIIDLTRDARDRSGFRPSSPAHSLGAQRDEEVVRLQAGESGRQRIPNCRSTVAPSADSSSRRLGLKVAPAYSKN